MTPEAVIALITFLDNLFKLGGNLIQAAVQKEPVLNVTSLPDLTDVDQARKDAIIRIS